MIPVDRHVVPRTPLIGPRRHFRAGRPGFDRAVLVVATLTTVGVAAVAAVSVDLSASVEGALVVENPRYPGDAVCGSAASDSGGCDRPASIERSAGDVLWLTLGRLRSRLLLGIPVAWIVAGSVLHVGSWAAGAKGPRSGGRPSRRAPGDRARGRSAVGQCRLVRRTARGVSSAGPHRRGLAGALAALALLALA